MKIRKTNDGRFMFFCPACKCGHWFNDTWQFDGNMEKPTISPSILVTGTQRMTDDEIERIKAGEIIEPRPMRCHSFVKNGVIEFLDDCTHPIRGNVELEDF